MSKNSPERSILLCFARMRGSKFCLLKERNGPFLCLCVHGPGLCCGEVVPPAVAVSSLSNCGAPAHASAAVITSWFRTAGLSLPKKGSRVCPLLRPGQARHCLRSVAPSLMHSANKSWAPLHVRHCFRHLWRIKEQDKMSCSDGVYFLGEFQPQQ